MGATKHKFFVDDSNLWYSRKRRLLGIANDIIPCLPRVVLRINGQTMEFEQANGEQPALKPTDKYKEAWKALPRQQFAEIEVLGATEDGAQPVSSSATGTVAPSRREQSPTKAASASSVTSNLRSPLIRPCRNEGLLVGIDVAEVPEKGFTIASWFPTNEDLFAGWEEPTTIRHTVPITADAFEEAKTSLAKSDWDTLADATYSVAYSAAQSLWAAVEKRVRSCPYCARVDVPSGFSLNSLGHGRLTEKTRLPGVSFQSTPSTCCGIVNNGTWAWMLFGRAAYASLKHKGQVSREEWYRVLKDGAVDFWDTLRPCPVSEAFPTADIAVMRTNGIPSEILAEVSSIPDQSIRIALTEYLSQGVQAVKQSKNPLYDKVDAVVAALGGLPWCAWAKVDVAWTYLLPTAKCNYQSDHCNPLSVEGAILSPVFLSGDQQEEQNI